jgi:replicative DNA helicase
MVIDLDEFEKIIAFKAITDATYLNTIADYVKPDYFSDSSIATYFKIVDHFYSKYKKLPNITEIKMYLVNDSLKRNFKKLVESFKDIDTNLNKDELYLNTERFLKERATWVQMVDIAENAEEKVKNPQSVLEAFDEICKINLHTDKGIEIFKNVDKLIDDILSEDNYIPSGWEWLDESLGGGYLEDGKALYIFAGQANIGKSIFLGNVATNIAKQGKSVLIISLEMSEMIYAKRLASNITKIPMKDFKYETAHLRSKMRSENSNNPDGKIFIKEFPPSTVSPKQLEAFIEKMKSSGERIDAVVIDYISLLTTSFGSNSYERIKHICEQIRALSYVFECPFISAVQFSRGTFGKDNPGMEGIAESIGVAATADVILSIFQTDEDQEMGIIKLGMIKNRYGPRGMIQPMIIDYSTLTINQSDENEETMGDSELGLLEMLSED